MMIVIMIMMTMKTICGDDIINVSRIKVKVVMIMYIWIVPVTAKSRGHAG